MQALSTMDSRVIIYCNLWIPFISAIIAFMLNLNILLIFFIFIILLLVLFYLVALSMSNQILRGILLINVSLHFLGLTYIMYEAAMYVLKRGFNTYLEEQVIVYFLYFPVFIFFVIYMIRYFIKGYKCLFNK